MWLRLPLSPATVGCSLIFGFALFGPAIASDGPGGVGVLPDGPSGDDPATSPDDGEAESKQGDPKGERGRKRNRDDTRVTTQVTANGALSVTPVADAHVRADQPSGNFGQSTGIRVDGDPVANGYLRFDVQVPAGETVTSAKLKVYSSNSSGSGITVHGVSDTSWDETRITYNNAPSIGDKVGGSGSYSANAYVSVDVTPLVRGSGPVSMAIKRSSSSSNTFKSREAGSDPPQLVVDSAAPTPAADTVVYALGDGADGSTPSRDLANYVKSQNPDRFFYLGDVYDTGTASEFTNRYDPLYGSLASITDPLLGNHEYSNRGTGYYPYWQNKRGWTQEQAKHRSYVDRSGWQVIAYSSETDMTKERDWVASALAKHSGTCRIVMAHKGAHVVVDTSHGDNSSQNGVWSTISNKAAINLVGHNHIYGRLAPINGVNVIVSGAGGHGLRSLGTQHHTVADSQTGVATATRLVLRQGFADFQQVDKSGTPYDSGTITCTPAS